MRAEECDRCGGLTLSTIMSMYSHELICMKCKEEERKRDDYHLAEAADLEEFAMKLPFYQRASVLKLAGELRANGGRKTSEPLHDQVDQEST